MKNLNNKTKVKRDFHKHDLYENCRVRWGIRQDLIDDLDSKCIAKKTELRPDTVEITFEMPEPEREEKEEYREIHSQHRGHMKLKGVYPMFPPKVIKQRYPDADELTNFTMKYSNKTVPNSYDLKYAKCRHYDSAAFRPDNSKVFLDVDFGKEKELSAITVSGRTIPFTKYYATTGYLYENKIWPGGSWFQCSRCNDNPKRGYFTRMIQHDSKHYCSCPSGSSDVLYVIDKPMKEYYFRKYDIQYRMNSGKQWTSLGIHDGPANNFDEKVHFVDLRCRYIRFIPQTCSDFKDRGMKVAFFSNTKQPVNPDITKMKNTVNLSLLRDDYNPKYEIKRRSKQCKEFTRNNKRAKFKRSIVKEYVD